MKKQIIISENSFEKVRKKIKEIVSDNNLSTPKALTGGRVRESRNNCEIIFSSNNDELNRKVLEKIPINILLINQTKRKDRQKQRDSGFNQVLAKIAKKKNTTIGIKLDEIIDSKAKQKAEILGRIIQNIKLCNKNKLKMNFISQKYKRDSKDLKSLGLVLGMPTNITREL